jgi:hypothetical protein
MTHKDKTIERMAEANFAKLTADKEPTSHELWEACYEASGAEHIPALVEALQNVDYHHDLFMQVSDCADFSHEERMMQLSNLCQAAKEAGKALAKLPEELRGE